MFTFPIAFFKAASGGGGGDTYTNYYSNDFDGVNDYVEAPTLADLGITGDTFSISFWMKNSGTVSNYRMILGSTTNASWNNGFGVMYNTAANPDRLQFWVNNNWSNASQIATKDITATDINNWNHVVCTYDGTNTKIYVNGVKGTDGSLTGDVSPTTNPLMFGRAETATGSSYDFAGKIDEVAIFDSALSASDVTAIYNSGSPDSLASQSNLKGWWRMGDGANYPIIKNQAHFSQTATDYDGTDDYVDLGDSDTFSFGDGSTDSAFSISAWIYREGTLASHDGIVCKDATSNREWALYIYSGKMRLVLFDNSAGYIGRGYNAVQIPINTWHHIAATYDGGGAVSDIKLYLNGTQVDDANISSGAYTAMENTTAAAMIGNKEIDPLYFDGKIDDVLITSTELSSSDVTDIYNSGYPKDESERSGLVAYYKFDGDTYPVVRDETEFSNASLDFDGTDDYVDLNNGASVNPSSIVSLSCWVKFNSLSNYDGIFGKRMGTSVTMPFLLSLDNTSKIRFRTAQSDNTNKEIYTNSAVSTNTWYHVVAVADGTNIKLYLDGTLQTDTDTYDGTLKQSTADNVYIGRNANDYLNGKVSDAMIFSSALSASDVTGIYNSGKPKDESSLSNILGYWRIGDNTIPQHIPSALGYGTHSVDFDGTDDYIDCGQVSALASATAFTISGWFKQTTLDEQRFMFGTRISNNNMISCYTWNDGKMYLDIRQPGTAYADFDYSTVVTAGEWFHLAMVYDGSAVSNTDRGKLYINGSAVTLSYVNAFPASTLATQGNFRIGGLNGFTNEWYGNIKEVAIFSTNLSASDVTALYNSGKTKDLSSESNLTNYWRMGDGEDKFPNILDYKGTAHGTMTNMASDDITTDNVGSGYIWNSPDIVADSPAGTSGQMTNMASDAFVAAKGAGTMTNMTAEDIVASTPS